MCVGSGSRFSQASSQRVKGNAHQRSISSSPRHPMFHVPCPALTATAPRSLDAKARVWSAAGTPNPETQAPPTTTRLPVARALGGRPVLSWTGTGEQANEGRVVRETGARERRASELGSETERRLSFAGVPCVSSVYMFVRVRAGERVRRNFSTLDSGQVGNYGGRTNLDRPEGTGTVRCSSRRPAGGH